MMRIITTRAKFRVRGGVKGGFKELLPNTQYCLNFRVVAEFQCNNILHHSTACE